MFIHHTALLQDHATLKGRHSGVSAEKTEIEFLAGGDSLFCDALKASTVRR
jgi:hypothetical protein